MTDLLVLGVTALSVLPLVGELFAKPRMDQAVVKITVGSHDPYLDDGIKDILDGTVPNVALFDDKGRRIGFKSGVDHGWIGSGLSHDIIIEPYDKGNTNDPEHITISASGKDAICIVAVTVTGADSREGGASQRSWNGQFGAWCKQPWYPSRKLIFDKSDERPPCVWISDDGRFPMGFSLHMADFSGEDLITQYREEPKMLCDSKPRQQFHKSINELQCPPVFKRFPKLDPDTGLEDPKEVLVEGVTACKPVIGEAVGRKEMDKLRKVERNRTVGIRPTYGVKRNRIMGRRENTKAQRPFGCEFKHAVVVNKGYTAKHLCEDPNSAGADYGNREEGLFCDMCSKKLWSFCSAKVTSNCFDEGERAIRGQNSGLKRDNTGTPMHKRYVAVQAWDD